MYRKVFEMARRMLISGRLLLGSALVLLSLASFFLSDAMMDDSQKDMTGTSIQKNFRKFDFISDFFLLTSPLDDCLTSYCKPANDSCVQTLCQPLVSGCAIPCITLYNPDTLDSKCRGGCINYAKNVECARPHMSGFMRCLAGCVYNANRGKCGNDCIATLESDMEKCQIPSSTQPPPTTTPPATTKPTPVYPPRQLEVTIKPQDIDGNDRDTFYVGEEIYIDTVVTDRGWPVQGADIKIRLTHTPAGRTEKLFPNATSSEGKFRPYWTASEGDVGTFYVVIIASKNGYIEGVDDTFVFVKPQPTPPPTTAPPPQSLNIYEANQNEKLAIDDLSRLIFEAANTPHEAVSAEVKITIDVIERGGTNNQKGYTFQESVEIKNHKFQFEFWPLSKEFSNYFLTTGNGKIEVWTKDISGKDLLYGFKEFEIVRPPTVIVHGIWSNWGEMKDIKDYIESYSFEYVYIFDFSPNNGDINVIAKGLKSFVETKMTDDLKKDKVAWSRFNIVAHSSGGLVARKYMYDNILDNKVWRFVSIATPHNGSPAANLLAYWRNISGKISYDPGWGPFNQRNDLTYGERVDRLEEDVSGNTGNPFVIGDYGVMVEQLTIPGNADISNDLYLALQLPMYVSPQDVGLMEKTGLPVGSFVSDLNEKEKPPFLGGIEMLCIAAHLPETYLDHWGQGFFNEKNDGLVTIESACSLCRKYRRPHITIGDTDHSGVKNLVSTLEHVINFLTGRNYTNFSSFSPVGIHVYDKNGRHTGPTEGGGIETQIPDSSYFEENGSIHVTIYGSDDYEVIYEAYGDGNANFSIVRQIAEEGMKIISFNDINVNRDATYKMSIGSSQEESTLLADLNGDNVVDERIQPSDYQFYPPETPKPTKTPEPTKPPKSFDIFSIVSTTCLAAIMFLIIVGAVIVIIKKGKRQRSLKMPIRNQICEECGRPIPEDSEYCSYCGDKQGTERTSFCENCGRPIPEDSTYCPYCRDRQGEA